MQQLSGKTAIVTGGGSGIGLAIAKALLNEGMNVVIADVIDAHLEQTRNELGEADNLLLLKLDVTDREAFNLFADQVEARFGKIHLLVNNAGVVVSGPIVNATFNDWDWVTSVNLTGVANGLVTILPRLLSHGEGGHIVNTASTSGLLPHPGAAIYTCTKSAVIGLSEAIRCELEPKGIIVSVFCPGPVQSKITESEKRRPASFTNSNSVQQEDPARREHAEKVFRLMMPAEEAASIVIEGIKNDLLYILTHSEHRTGLEARAKAIMSALPDRPENPELQVMASSFNNPAYSSEINRHQK